MAPLRISCRCDNYLRTLLIQGARSCLQQAKLANPQTASAEQISDKAPSFGQVISILLLPLVLIFMDTGLNTLGVMGVIDKGADWVNVLRMVGKTPVALLITVKIFME